MKDLSSFKVNQKETIRNAFKQKDLNKHDCILVTDEEDKVLGIVTDGDLRRAIWSFVPLDIEIEAITNKNFVYVSEDFNINEIKNIFLEKKLLQIPILKDGKLIDILYRSDFKEYDLKHFHTNLKCPVVIMAGGRGTRLDPFTHILPKALIPIKGKPILEIILEKYHEQGMKDFYISVNHKEKMIRAYFEEMNSLFNITYIKEDKPLGTVGGLRFLDNQIKTTFFVSNCDIIIEDDYEKIYNFHKDGGFVLTIVGAMQNHVVSYGVCNIENGGELKEFVEKPQYDFLVNTGMYIFEPEVIKLIPYNERLDFTDLVKTIKKAGKKIGVYPVSENTWIDIGQWSEYKKNLSKLRFDPIE